MTFPTPHTVIHEQVTGVTEGALGNDVPTFAAGVERKAYSYAPHRVETLDGHTSRDVAEMDLAMPAVTVGLMDRFTVNDVVYETVGVRDLTGGFHGWKPGIVVELKRVTG